MKHSPGTVQTNMRICGPMQAACANMSHANMHHHLCIEEEGPQLIWNWHVQEEDDERHGRHTYT